MRRFVLVGATVLAIAGIGGAFAWATSRPDVDLLTVHETEVAPAPIEGTQDASVVWTGDDFIAWGGGSGDKASGQVTASGAAYDPTAESWRTLSSAPIEARERHAAVWTGTEMVVWGGTRRHHGVGDLLDGALYNPATDSWRAMSTAPVGTDRSGGQAVVVEGWVVIGAGYGPTGDEERTVLMYDLSEDRWETVPVGDRVIHLLSVGDRVALLTVRQAVQEDETNELRVLLLDPATGDAETLGRLDLELYPAGAGLLAHDGELTLVVSPREGQSTLYPIDGDGGSQQLEVGRTLDLTAPVSLFGDAQPQPIFHDDARRILITHPNGPVTGIDLATGAVAKGGHLDGSAKCLPNGSFAVGGSQLFVWGAADCMVGSVGPEGPALVEISWESDAQ